MLKRFSYCQADDPYNNGCFEILGFDVMLGDDQRPILLEANHNPSLTTGSAVDQKVKEALVSDTFTLLGITPQRKKILMQMKKKFIQERIVMGKRSTYNKNVLHDSCVKEKDRFMLQNKGGFEMIYPPENVLDLNENYDGFMEKASELISDLSRSQSYWSFSKASLGGKKANLFTDYNRHLNNPKSSTQSGARVFKLDLQSSTSRQSSTASLQFRAPQSRVRRAGLVDHREILKPFPAVQLPGRSILKFPGLPRGPTPQATLAKKYVQILRSDKMKKTLKPELFYSPYLTTQTAKFDKIKIKKIKKKELRIKICKKVW